MKSKKGFRYIEPIRKENDMSEAVKGKWIPIKRGEKGYSAGDFRCSVCGEPNHCYRLTPYCAMCGAKIEGVQKKEEQLCLF